MAGYPLYSLDWEKFSAFLQSPSDTALARMAEEVSDMLDELDQEFEDDDPVAQWPSDPAELTPLIKQRIALNDWYGDLSNEGCEIWERALIELCQDEEDPAGLDFEVESDGVYWTVVEEAAKFHRQTQVGIMEISHFGTRPLRYHHIGKLASKDWTPYHSMHTPNEVAAMVDQFQAAQDAIESSPAPEVAEDYEELMRVLEKVKQKKRLLYIAVDT